MKRFIFLFFFLAGCGSTQMATTLPDQEALHIALLDVKQAYSRQNMELNLLREKLDKVQVADKGISSAQISLDIQRRFSEIEKTLAKAKEDLKELQKHANQTSQSLRQYSKQIRKMESQIKRQSEHLQDIANLKQTLDSISKAIGATSSTSHHVQPGDSLEKIAKKYHTTVKELKVANGLRSNKIIVGQKLNIPQ